MRKDLSIPTIRSEHTNVVSLAHEALGQSPESFPACRDLRAYWEALRGSRQMPARSEFDPRGIEDTLACTFVAEKVAPSVARIRVAGSVMNEALGMDVRGMPITAFFDPASREALCEAVRDVLTSPAIVEVDLSARRSFGRKPIRARMLLLPMSDAEGGITRVVGCLDIQGGLGKTPRRFQVCALRRTAVFGDEPISTAPQQLFKPRPNEAVPRPEYAFAENKVAFRSARTASEPMDRPAPRTERNGLRLVVDNA